MTDRNTPPKYNVTILESAILEIAAELEPQNLTAREFLQKVAGDANDRREVETAVQAIRNLREIGLLANRDDDTVELTRAALRVLLLLA